MTYLVAIVYPHEHRAAEVMAMLRRLQSECPLDLENACWVTRPVFDEVRPVDLALQEVIDVATQTKLPGQS